MGLETIQGRRDKSKLMLLASMSEERYRLVRTRILSRQRKVWSNNLFGSLVLNKAEWLNERG